MKTKIKNPNNIVKKICDSLLSLLLLCVFKDLLVIFIVFTANAAKEHMSPYFQQIVEMLKGYLTVDQADETMSLQVQSLGITFFFHITSPHYWP